MIENLKNDMALLKNDLKSLRDWKSEIESLNNDNLDMKIELNALRNEIKELKIDLEKLRCSKVISEHSENTNDAPNMQRGIQSKDVRNSAEYLLPDVEISNHIMKSSTSKKLKMLKRLSKRYQKQIKRRNVETKADDASSSSDEIVIF